MATEGVGRRADWVGRGVGLAVFAGGIILLIVVFVWTHQLGDQMPQRGEAWQVTDGIRFGVAVAKLFISGLVASWIAGRGAQLYAAANRALYGE